MVHKKLTNSQSFFADINNFFLPVFATFCSAFCDHKKGENKLGTQINADDKNQQTRLNKNKSA